MGDKEIKTEWFRKKDFGVNEVGKQEEVKGVLYIINLLDRRDALHEK